jgi:hypothetical protein
MLRKELGKIQSVRFGNGGYQDCQFGLWVELSGSGWGVGDGFGAWSMSMSSKGCKWTEADRDAEFAKTMRKTNELMLQAKVDTVDKLVGTPVEITFDGNMLKEWRVLTEVL